MNSWHNCGSVHESLRRLSRVIPLRLPKISTHEKSPVPKFQGVGEPKEPATLPSLLQQSSTTRIRSRVVSRLFSTGLIIRNRPSGPTSYVGATRLRVFASL